MLLWSDSNFFFFFWEKLFIYLFFRVKEESTLCMLSIRIQFSVFTIFFFFEMNWKNIFFITFWQIGACFKMDNCCCIDWGPSSVKQQSLWIKLVIWINLFACFLLEPGTRNERSLSFMISSYKWTIIICLYTIFW